MRGVMGSVQTPFFAAQLCGVSAKSNHSNSIPVMVCKPSFSACLNTRFKVWRGRRVGRAVGVDELAQEERHAVVPGHMARGCKVQPRQCVGEAVLPAGDLCVVVTLVGAVPAEDHVAEAEACIHCAEELDRVQVRKLSRYLPTRRR